MMEKPYMKAMCSNNGKRKNCYFMFIKLEILLKYRSVKPEKADIKPKKLDFKLCKQYFWGVRGVISLLFKTEIHCIPFDHDTLMD